MADQIDLLILGAEMVDDQVQVAHMRGDAALGQDSAFKPAGIKIEAGGVDAVSREEPGGIEEDMLAAVAREPVDKEDQLIGLFRRRADGALDFLLVGSV